ncbi:hypothetical protein BDF20DRAFT_857563 [Mycotypha africana]|uniref:uncharacterized protein n=1 Tax=Mycotypha africana TaxID=64632 RepID=UPI002300F75A|nr:uncharacterized protein BDF20DRAFT_857563 [Mycotypha africana]KAI8984014.1 hypothetical protein BDF20DRAFT_857563 [Mycotypha africana]
MTTMTLDQSYCPVTLCNNDNSSKKDLDTNPSYDGGDDKILQHILKKLDEGSETIINLHSLLNMKTVELNELTNQLQLIDQVLTNVEKGTEQMEMILKDMVGNNDDGRTASSISILSRSSSTKSMATLYSPQDSKLVDAEAALDSAIKSASCLYTMDHNSRYEPITEREILLNKIYSLLKQLNIPLSSIEDYKKDDIKVLQKAYVDLDLAKNIATSIRNNYRYRTTLLKKRHPPVERIKQMGEDIRKQVALYKTYTKNACLCIHGKEDILSILDREDALVSTTTMLTKKVIHACRVTHTLY